MLTYYLILDIPFNASDEEIRNSYLKFVKKYTPEKDPIKFKQVTAAYEALKDKRRRIKSKLFGGLDIKNTKEALMQLAHAKTPKRQRVGLKKLVEIEAK